ncbi:MAG: penicillin-binding protein 2 [Lentisphaerae bacterium]|jgi:penicillin-binding protein 2|nr:penicillin-binding protein 2 [Lentisphaerota bacterium]
MELHGTSQTFDGWRIPLLGLIFLAGFLLLGARLYNVQVKNAATFSGRLNRQSIRRVLLPSARGRIFDRNGVILADNRPNMCLAMFVEEMRRSGGWDNTINAVAEQADRVAEIIGQPHTLSREAIAAHVNKRLPLPLVAWDHLDEQTIARFEERTESVSGVDVHVLSERVYPLGKLAAHIIGYAGRDTPDPANDERYHYTVMGMYGRAGIEAQYNSTLAGVPGYQLLRVDVSGYRRVELQGTDPKPGRDLTLTIDTTLQREVENTLAGEVGACVVLDVRNGDILAMASLPSFDPNTLSPAPSHAFWTALQKAPDHPLFNRAIQGRYPPGSTFKMVTALAALGQPGFDPKNTYFCEGIYDLNPRPIRCAFGEHHGTVGLRLSMRHSCNGYFCHIAAEMGPEPMRQMARALGMGAKTGIDLPGEAEGLVPDEARKKEVYKDIWRLGDTCLMSIGQGDLLTTPLQLAVATAAIANGGQVLRPRLVQSGGQGVAVMRNINWQQGQIEEVKRGLEEVITLGTGRRVRGSAVTAAGKTGTAEYGTRANLKRHAWMIAYAPAEAPSVAISIVIEDADDTAGIAAAPMVRRILTTIFGAAPTPEAAPTEVPPPPATTPIAHPSTTVEEIS